MRKRLPVRSRRLAIAATKSCVLICSPCAILLFRAFCLKSIPGILHLFVLVLTLRTELWRNIEQFRRAILSELSAKLVVFLLKIDQLLLDDSCSIRPKKNEAAARIVNMRYGA